MKEKKIQQYQAMSTPELQQELIALLKNQFSIRMQKVSGQFKKHHLIKEIRRNVARVKTLLRERELKGESA
jgi:large subunit ribosomal protein L29